MRARTADPRVRGRYLAWLVVSVRGSLHSGVRALLRLDARAHGGQTCVACRSKMQKCQRARARAAARARAPVLRCGGGAHDSVCMSVFAVVFCDAWTCVGVQRQRVCVCEFSRGGVGVCSRCSRREAAARWLGGPPAGCRHRCFGRAGGWGASGTAREWCGQPRARARMAWARMGGPRRARGRRPALAGEARAPRRACGCRSH